ncbi:hypothetical protein [Pseudobacter ginsenosidimutans]|uniref:Uncharacterized protein n=1 Tax=Pseudobacter ginsenosidimutans TaxID=661488 RepID=A0A4Q7MUI2_9BACT|nr:hypothetical protein [Pseudobacter ginsenosidimutans]QEC40716.1 hypothetical protein FSB84_03010 [Pseudobacter ginsenosidimutans]RZS72566.1 hypothetical protein EV199_4487 [Pseudobacter ginsenosidimutans]
MTIFKTYTGNAMLNNALMTIEALARLKSVSAITPSLLKELYHQVDLKETNKRLKNYTMLFTNNGPLHNNKGNDDRVYGSLFSTIVSNFESEGANICEISGLAFQTTFNEFYELALKEAGFSNKEIGSKDTNISRTWFPLIGSLGSDAQALPQAKFTVQIHPICIAVLQFLPLSALLYKRGILLVDSSNFELSREMVAQNTQTLSEKIQNISLKESVENVRDFSKGDYLLKALDILAEKEDFEETYSDLNMWSFSNSGTGANCEIDRIPNFLIRKLQRLYTNAKIDIELKGILAKNETAYSFIKSLEKNTDWSLLYPNVFGSGKKAIRYEGVSPEFMEAYYAEVGKTELLPTAKYIAGLIQQYKSKAFEKLLVKTDGWNDPEYKVELFRVLVKATEDNKWGLEQHIAILDNKDELPIKNTYYQFQKLIHYFTWKKVQSNTLPPIYVLNTKVLKACKWIISLIQKDDKVNAIKSNLTNPNENAKVGFNRIVFDALANTEIALEEVIEILYDEEYNYRKYGLNEVLRIFFSQTDQQEFEFENLKSNLNRDALLQNWIAKIKSFANDYRAYYFGRYQGSGNGGLPHNKFQKTIDPFIKENDNFYTLLIEAIFNTNQFIKEREHTKDDKWKMEDLMTNPLGNNNRNICVLAVKFLLKETSIKPLELSIIN